jgi:hypothetical protein
LSPPHHRKEFCTSENALQDSDFPPPLHVPHPTHTTNSISKTYPDSTLFFQYLLPWPWYKPPTSPPRWGHEITHLMTRRPPKTLQPTAAVGRKAKLEDWVGGVGCRLNPIMKWANELNKQFWGVVD